MPALTSRTLHRALASGPDDRWTGLAFLLVRAVAGLALAFGHGLGKVPPSDKFVEGTAAMGFPVPVLFAWAAALSELLGGILLALGLLTRPSAALIAITMGVALFVRHAGDPFAAREKALLYLTLAVLFLVAGAGRYSVDRVLGGGRR